jgi:hypothetical protein
VRLVRFFLLGAAALAMLAPADVFARAHHERDEAPETSLFKAGGLQFTMPGRWIAATAASPVRAGQWRIPAAHGAPPGPDDAELVVFYFGPGLGGTARENIDGWRGTVLDASGTPVAGEVSTRQSGGFKISELVAAGMYLDPVPMPGLPPIPRPNEELAGVVVENPNGNLYWRLTGPEPLVSAALPLLRRTIDSVKPLTGG